MFDSLFPKEWTTLQRLMWLKTNALARAVYEIVTGNPVSFTAKAAPLRQLKVAFSPVQSGSGDPSPDNVRPISGWDSLNVEQRGRNLLHIGNAPIDETQNGCRLEINGASGHLSGTSTVNNGTLPAGYANHYIELPAGTYTLSSTNFMESGCYLRARWDAVSGSAIVNESGVPNGYTFTLTSFRKLYITVGVYGMGAGGFKENIDFDFEIQIELGNEKTDFAPYNPSSRSISISLGSTVYSGWVDVVTGVLTVTHQIVDLGTLDWTYYAYAGHGGGYSGGLMTVAKKNEATEIPNSVCSALEPLEDAHFNYASYNTGHCFAINQYATVKVTHPNATDAETLKSVLSGVQLCYELATPIPIQLTPQEVQSLLGDNVLFSDANGDLTVTYRSN